MRRTVQEQLVQQPLNYFQNVRRHLLSPMPAALLNSTNQPAFKTLCDRFQHIPDFTHFHPLDCTQDMALPEAASAEAIKEVTTLKQGILDISTRDQHKTASKNISLFEKPNNTFKDRPASASELKKTDHSFFKPSPSHPVNSLNLSKPTSALPEKSHGIHSKSHTDKKIPTANNLSSNTPKLLVNLITAIDSLSKNVGHSHSVDTPVSTVTADNGVSQNKQQGDTPFSSLTPLNQQKPSNKNQQNDFLKTQGRRQSHADKTSIMRDAKIHKPKPETIAKNRPNHSSPAILTGLVAQIWDRVTTPQNLTTDNKPSANRPAAPESKPTSQPATATQLNGGLTPLNLGQNNLFGNSALTPLPAQQSPHQAEEMAEKINQVLREQAWLRGVNLP